MYMQLIKLHKQHPCGETPAERHAAHRQLLAGIELETGPGT